MVHLFFFFFNDTATTEIYTLSLHDALPILPSLPDAPAPCLIRPILERRLLLHLEAAHRCRLEVVSEVARGSRGRSEEHTSELQSRQYLVCRLLLEKKKKIRTILYIHRS